jgi:hypothetical protein
MLEIHLNLHWKDLVLDIQWTIHTSHSARRHQGYSLTALVLHRHQLHLHLVRQLAIILLQQAHDQLLGSHKYQLDLEQCALPRLARQKVYQLLLEEFEFQYAVAVELPSEVRLFRLLTRLGVLITLSVLIPTVAFLLSTVALLKKLDSCSVNETMNSILHRIVANVAVL